MRKETSLQTLGQRQRLLEWSQKVADCRQSGLSVKRWCSENGTSVKTYYSWQTAMQNLMRMSFLLLQALGIQKKFIAVHKER